MRSLTHTAIKHEQSKWDFIYWRSSDSCKFLLVLYNWLQRSESVLKIPFFVSFRRKFPWNVEFGRWFWRQFQEKCGKNDILFGKRGSPLNKTMFGIGAVSIENSRTGSLLSISTIKQANLVLILKLSTLCCWACTCQLCASFCWSNMIS